MSSPAALRNPCDDPDRATIRQRIGLTVRGRTTESHAEIVSFDGLCDGREHISVMWPSDDDTPLVRVHSECLTGDVFGSMRCDCGDQLDDAIDVLSEAGGVLLYLRQEGRGVGLYNKLDAYALQDAGLDTVDANLSLGLPADGRDYTVAGQMLQSLKIDRIRLITNNPDKQAQLQRFGIDVVQRISTLQHANPENAKYLQAKRERMGHLLPDPLEPIGD
ncbi:MAG: GTP cyclohydrolase II [Propionibacteriaceae bacterium]